MAIAGPVHAMSFIPHTFHASPAHSIPSHPFPSHPTQSNPIQSHPIRSHPIPSHPNFHSCVAASCSSFSRLRMTWLICQQRPCAAAHHPMSTSLPQTVDLQALFLPVVAQRRTSARVIATRLPRAMVSSICLPSALAVAVAVALGMVAAQAVATQPMEERADAWVLAVAVTATRASDNVRCLCVPGRTQLC